MVSGITYLQKFTIIVLNKINDTIQFAKNRLVCRKWKNYWVKYLGIRITLKWDILSYNRIIFGWKI